MRTLPALLSGVVILATAAPVLADTVLLKNGRTISGKILREEGDHVVMEVMDGQGRITLGKSAIARTWRGDEQPPPRREGIFPAGKAAVSTAPPAAEASPSTADLEAKLKALGPSREELLSQLQPTGIEADELAALERRLASGSPDDAERLAGKGRVALVVAARALASSDARTLSAAEKVVARLAVDERALPFVLALGIPEKLVALADSADARRALAAIARTDVAQDVDAGQDGNATGAVARWRAWWEKEKAELGPFEQKRDEERARIRAELARRGVRPYSDRKSRIDVRLASSEEPRLPEPTLVLPRLVLTAPSVALRGEGGTRQLVLSTAIENAGEGALELRAGDPARVVQRVLARYPGDARIVLEHETSVAQPLVRLELLDQTFAPALGAAAGREAAIAFVGSSSHGVAVGAAHAVEGQVLAIADVPDGVYYAVVALEAGFEQSGTPADRVAAVKVRLEGRAVTLLARLRGDELLALEAQRREGLGDR
jgi:hypothetical protein